ncbi:MAG: methenyltetrahydromethanopterin cyclohydrolase [Bacteroidales bacterium]|nr:methenyltetrahydromethanopterin cyclohydrolase [Bacteroidales bacterium]
MPTLNQSANHVADELALHAERYGVTVQAVGGARLIDCGVHASGGIAAGVMLTRVCLADRGTVAVVPGWLPDFPTPAVQVHTDDPVRACLASQYAGWQVKTDSYFAMGSGPMRALAAREELFSQIPGREECITAVGVLETKKLPAPEAVVAIVNKLPITAEKLTLLAAPAASLAGTIQVVARSVETALHKLHELRFDVTCIRSGYGVAPLPPVAANELAAIGRTNDAILYGGRVTLWVDTEDATIEQFGPQVPSSASRDYGAPFAEVFARYGDFYQIDPLLFSPAEVTFVNLRSGRAWTWGRLAPELLRKSFFGG